VADRLQSIRQILVDQQLEALLISQPENLRYLSGFTGREGYLLITAERAVLATDSRYVEQASWQAPLFEVVLVVGEPEQTFELLLDRLFLAEKEDAEHSETMLLGPGSAPLPRLGFEADSLSFATYRRLEPIAERRSLDLVPTSGLVEELRMVKDDGELREIEKAVAVTDEAYAHLLNVLRPGMTEKEAAWEIEKYEREHGAEAVAFDIIVASGPQAALPHAEPSDKPIVQGETIVIDMGARANGYNSDLTRTICLGTPPDELRRIYEVVLNAQEAALAGIQAGMTGAAADALARQVIESAGYGEAFGHSLGHGLGLAVHEMPGLRRQSAQILRDGMVFTVEPGIYLPGRGGVRIEDTVVLENGRVRVLSKAAKSRELGSKRR